MLVRGLNASVAVSGMRSVRNLVPVDNAFIDRIEVVKGPTGVLYRWSPPTSFYAGSQYSAE